MFSHQVGVILKEMEQNSLNGIASLISNNYSSGVNAVPSKGKVPEQWSTQWLCNMIYLFIFTFQIGYFLFEGYSLPFD